MVIKSNFKVGGASYQVDIDEKDPMEALHWAIVLSNPMRKCICGNTEDFFFTSNKDTEGNIYVNVKCPKCDARSKLGRYKSGGIFWKSFEKYIPQDKEHEKE